MALLRGQFAAKMAKTVGQCGTTHNCDSRIGTWGCLFIVPARPDFVEELALTASSLPSSLQDRGRGLLHHRLRISARGSLQLIRRVGPASQAGPRCRSARDTYTTIELQRTWLDANITQTSDSL